MILIFDLDGTLINSKKRHSILMEKLLKKHKINIPYNFEKEYLNFKDCGNSNKNYLSSILNLPLELVNEICAEWINEIESDELIEYDVLYDETIFILEKLKNDNVIIYLSSRARKNTLINSLRKLKIYDYASEIYVTNPKDGYEGKSQILEKIKKSTDDKIVMIGDTEVDYMAARNQNIQSYILNRGFRNKGYWNHKKVKTFDNLYKCLKI